jgi:hypothetical protein
MKQLFFVLKKSVTLRMLFFIALISSSLFSCQKTADSSINNSNNSSLNIYNNAAQYSSVVIDKWITMQLRLMRDAVGIPNVAFARYYAYSGIAAFEAQAAPDLTNASFSSKWNGLTNLPQANKFQSLYSPASVNTALAFMNRNMFITASATDKAAIDSLENALNISYLALRPANVIASSDSFGKFVATAVFNWSETDGYKNASNPYTPPVGPGLWVSTPPAFALASTPYWGNNRPIVAGSINNTQPGAPITYSEDSNSPFYKMVLQLYNTSQSLTNNDSSMALFWRDVPGVTSPGHWESILQQVIQQTGTHLDKAVFAYAFTGTCLNDACISCWQTKYHYNLVRPITYIQNVLGHTTWLSLLTTPAHPEYSSAHAVLSAATAKAFQAVFGNIGSFTDHTYDYMGYAPRTFSSFRAIGEDAGNSRFYAGIHYQPSIDTGLVQGRKVTANIIRILGLHEK